METVALDYAVALHLSSLWAILVSMVWNYLFFTDTSDSIGALGL